MKRNTYCLCSNVHEPLLPKAQNQLIVNLEPPSGQEKVSGTIVHQLLLRSAMPSVGSAQEATAHEGHGGLAGWRIVGGGRTTAQGISGANGRIFQGSQCR